MSELIQWFRTITWMNFTKYFIFWNKRCTYIILIFLFCMINTFSLCKTKPNTDNIYSNDILRTTWIEKFIIYNFLMFNLSDFHCFKINPFSYPKFQKWRTQTPKRNKIPSNHATFFLTTGSLQFALARAELIVIWRILMWKPQQQENHNFWKKGHDFFVKWKHRSFFLKVNYKAAN